MRPRAGSSSMPTIPLRLARALFAALSPEIPTTRRLISSSGPLGVSWAPGIAETTASKVGSLLLCVAIAAQIRAILTPQGNTNDKGQRAADSRPLSLPLDRD